MAARILIIDDTPDNLKVAVDLLEAYCFVVRTALDGATGLRRARTVKPSLILLDVEMPGIDGYETCKRLKADEELRDIPVIFMTARTSLDDKIRAFELGGVDYVTKPFEASELIARVRTQVQIRSLQEELSAANAALHSQVADQRQSLGDALASRRTSDSELVRLSRLTHTQSEEMRRLSQLWDERSQARISDPAAALREHVRARLGLVASNLGLALGALPDADETRVTESHLDAALDLLEPLLVGAELEQSADATQSSPLRLLSERERRVLELVSEGWSTGRIAAELEVAVSTISTYRRRIKEKTGAESLAALIVMQSRG